MKRTAFFVPCFVFLVAGLFLNLAYSQKDIYFWVNVRYSGFLDDVMPWYTYVGDGLFCIAACILAALFLEIRFGIALAIGYAIEGIAVQVLKQLVFTHRPRPWAQYMHKFSIHVAPDFSPYSNNSFPSGHTATVFCMAALIVLAYPRLGKGLQFLVFLLALLVGYSRVYLSEHYFIDVYVGSVIGVVSALPVYRYFYLRKSTNPKRSWLHKTLLTLKK